MSKKFSHLVSLLFLALLLMIIPFFNYGCKGNVGLSEENEQAMDETSQSYLALRKTVSAEEARNTLVENLNNGSSSAIASAELGRDGYSIFLHFQDGQVGGLNTTEEFGNGNSYDPTNLLDMLQHTQNGNTTPVSGSFRKPYRNQPLKLSPHQNDATGNTLVTPTAKKVLLMSALSADFEEDVKIMVKGVVELIKGEEGQ